MTEMEMITTLLPCVDGPISNAAIQLIASGEFQHYASTRGVVIRILESHKHKPGRPSKLDRQSELLRRFRKTKGKLNPEFAKRQLRPQFKDLDDDEFAAATAKRPSGRIIKKAQEVECGRSSAAHSRLATEPTLASNQTNEGV